MTAKVAKVNKKLLRQSCARAGIKSFAVLAEHLRCARPSIYFALERPSRYPHLFKKLEEFCGQ
jgi:hypothetical protein